MPEHDPVYKVSIIPRGRALGVTMFLPEEDRYSHSRRHIISQITSLFGGRVAEEMTLGKTVLLRAPLTIFSGQQKSLAIW